MPIIPFRQNPVNPNFRLAKLEQDPQAMSASGRALMKVGSEIGQLSQAISRETEQTWNYVEAERKAKAELEYQTNKLNFDMEMDAYVAGYADKAYDDNYREQFQADVEEIKKKYFESIKDPTTREKLTPWMDHRVNMGRIQVDHTMRKLWIADARATFDENYQKDVGNYAGLEDQYAASEKRAEIVAKTEAMHRAGVLSASDARKYIFNLDNNRDVFQIKTLFQKPEGPEIAITALMERDEKGNFKNWQSLQPDQRAALVKEAKVEYNIKLTEREKLERETREDFLVAIYKKLNNPNISRLEVINDIEKATERDPVTGIRVLDPGHYQSIMNYIKHEQAGGSDVKTNMSTYWKLYEAAVFDPTNPGRKRISGDAIIAAQQSGLLSRSDTEDLLRTVVHSRIDENRVRDAQEKETEKTRAMITKLNLERIDAIFPKPNEKEKELRDQMKIALASQALRYKDPSDFGKIDAFASDMIQKYGKTGGWFGVSTKDAIAKVRAFNENLSAKETPVVQTANKGPGGKKPSFEDYYAEARKAPQNKAFSDDELRRKAKAVYDSKYGGR